MKKKNIQSAKYDYLGYWGQEQARMPHVLNDLFHDWGHDKGFLYDYEEKNFFKPLCKLDLMQQKSLELNFIVLLIQA